MSTGRNMRLVAALSGPLVVEEPAPASSAGVRLKARVVVIDDNVDAADSLGLRRRSLASADREAMSMDLHG